MPLNAKVSPLIENRKRGLAISDLIEQTRAKTPVIAQAFEHVQNTVNDLYQQMSKPAQVTEFTVTDPITGKQIAWIGGIAKGGVSYSGAAFSHLWVGPNADPATAPFFCDGSNVVIGKNGVVYVQDMAGNTGATFGVTQEAAKVITAATNAAPVVVTLAAHGYINGDTVLVAGAVGNTAINGYRIVQGVTANTFTLTDPAGVAINGNGALSGAPTATRYYAGVLAQVFAVGPSFAGYKLRAFADGSLHINGANFTIVSGDTVISITDQVIPGAAVPGVSVLDKVKLWSTAQIASAFALFNAANNEIGALYMNGAGTAGRVYVSGSGAYSCDLDGESGMIRTIGGGGIVFILPGQISVGMGAAELNLSAAAITIGGLRVVGPRLAAIPPPTGGGTITGVAPGGAVIDVEARAAIAYLANAVSPSGNTVDPVSREAINAIIARLSTGGHGLIS